MSPLTNVFSTHKAECSKEGVVVSCCKVLVGLFVVLYLRVCVSKCYFLYSLVCVCFAFLCLLLFYVSSY